MRIALALIAVLCGGDLAAQTTWIVDASGGGNFTDIPPAIAAAAPGDHIEVRGAGTYSAFVLDRGVDLFAPQHALVPTIEVVGVPLGQQARVTGLCVQRQGGARQVSVRSCAGSVLLVDVCEVGAPSPVAPAWPGLELLDAQRVYVHGGTFVGQDATGAGGDGIAMVRSSAVLSATQVQGGTTISTHPSLGDMGMRGICVGAGCQLLLDGAAVTGGAASGGTLVGGNGGHGITVDPTSLAIAVGRCTFVGAAGGSGSFLAGLQGYAVEGNVRHTLDCGLNGHAVRATAIADRPLLRVPMTVALGARLDVAISGEPGMVLWTMFDLAHDYLPLAVFDGALVLTAQATGFGLSSLDTNGAGCVGFAVPNDARLRGLEVFCQGAALVGVAPVLLAPAHTRTQ